MTITARFETPSPEVFVVDDDRTVLTAFSRLLGSAGYTVRAFASAQEFLSGHDPAVPGCALLDVRMAELDGLSLQNALTAQSLPRPVIFVTACDDAHTSVRAMKAGAIDYLVKPVDAQDLLSAVRAAIDVDRHAREECSQTADVQRRHDLLTPREKQVMSHVVRGRLNKQIAFDLDIVEKTVKVHRSRVMQKMNASSVAALVQMASRLDLADRPA
jgi:FixJ family two-component response regulator